MLQVLSLGLQRALPEGVKSISFPLESGDNKKYSLTVLTRSDHAVECAILSLIRTKLRRNQQGEKMYRNNLSGLTAAVTTLRLVSLKWR